MSALRILAQTVFVSALGPFVGGVIGWLCVVVTGFLGLLADGRVVGFGIAMPVLFIPYVPYTLLGVVAVGLPLVWIAGRWDIHDTVGLGVIGTIAGALFGIFLLNAGVLPSDSLRQSQAAATIAGLIGGGCGLVWNFGPRPRRPEGQPTSD